MRASRRRKIPWRFSLGNLSLLATNGMVSVRNSFPLGGSGVLSIVATNVHDEVLDDSAAIEVNLELWLKGRPEIRSVVRFGEAYLITPGFLSRGFLTMRPNVPMTINYPWSHLTEDASPFWDHVKLNEGYTTGGVQYCQSDTVTLIAQGSVRLFPHIAPIKLPARELRFIYRIYDYFCPIILESP